MRSWYGDNKTALALTVASRFNITGHEMSLRWTLHHSDLSSSKGDAIILGASRPEQLESSLTSCERGPLPEELVQALEEVWAEAEAEAPSYSPWVDTEGKVLVIDFAVEKKDE